MSDEPKEYDCGPYGKLLLTPEQFKNFQEMHNESGHKDFFEREKKWENPVARLDKDGRVDEKTARQHLRRQKELGKLFNDVSVTLKRVQPGSGANIEYISFEKWRDLQTLYYKAVKEEGMSESQALKEVGFQPLTTYIKKIHRQLPDGKIKEIRPVLVNEVGVRPNGTIVILEDKMPGDVGTVVVGPHSKHQGR